MLTEDRRATGILGVLSIADNVSIASLNKYLIGGIMLDDNKIRKARAGIMSPSCQSRRRPPKRRFNRCPAVTSRRC